VAVTDPLNRISSTVYDTADRMTEQIDPLLNTTQYRYDAASR
jgi:YD repeat-containing protein